MDKFLKIGFGVLAVLALIFGFIKLGQNLKLTFATGPGATEPKKDDALEETKLKVMDTDEDGLSDWEELNVRSTSPYLADSDSDGASDGDEVEANTDPNCPAGKECGSLQAVKAKMEQVTSPPDLPESLTGSEAEADSAKLPLEELKNLSADDVRALLKEGGVTDEQLQGVTDEELKGLLEETVSQQENF